MIVKDACGMSVTVTEKQNYDDETSGLSPVEWLERNYNRYDAIGWKYEWCMRLLDDAPDQGPRVIRSMISLEGHDCDHEGCCD